MSALNGIKTLGLVSFIVIFWVWTAKDRAHEYAILHELWYYEKWPDGVDVTAVKYVHDNAVGG